MSTNEEKPMHTILWAFAGLAAGLILPTLFAYAMGYLDPVLK